MARAIRYLVSLIMAFVALSLSAPYVTAGTVAGKFVTREGKPLPDQQLHFENNLSADIFIVHTGRDGSFSANLPPGTYDLRAEHGVVLKSPIRVGSGSENLGPVEDRAPADFRRLFQRETMAPTVVESAAPSTANVATSISPIAHPSPVAAPSPAAAK